jgi:hypothetical protein
MIEDSFSSGYNWCVDTIKMSTQHSQLANDLEINKAVMFLKQKDFASAVDTLKAFEKQASAYPEIPCLPTRTANCPIKKIKSKGIIFKTQY